MATLHIEHAISDFALWKAAFDRFAERRAQAGVIAHRVWQPLDDPHYVVIALDFESAEQARRFLGFLQTNVWASTESAPALVGTPQTRILNVRDEAWIGTRSDE